jgi:hypothetical protein
MARTILTALLAAPVLITSLSACATRTVYVTDGNADRGVPRTAQAPVQATQASMPYDEGYQDGYDAGIRSVDQFYEPLSPYGQWVNYPGYGRAFVPARAVVGAGFRPYSHGHWEYTEWGYTWVDHHPFGWATGHYGRWIYDGSYGWVWIPGTTWAPAWVTWRTGGGYVGWAPMPPGASFGGVYSVYDTSWVFVPTGRFGAGYVGSYVVVGAGYRNCYGVTSPYRSTSVYYGRTYYAGPQRTYVENGGGRVIHRPIRDVDADRPTSRPPRGTTIARPRDNDPGVDGGTRGRPGTSRPRDDGSQVVDGNGRPRDNDGNSGNGGSRPRDNDGTSGNGRPRDNDGGNGISRPGTDGRDNDVRPIDPRDNNPIRDRDIRPGSSTPVIQPGETGVGRPNPGTGSGRDRDDDGQGTIIDRPGRDLGRPDVTRPDDNDGRGRRIDPIERPEDRLFDEPSRLDPNRVERSPSAFDRGSPSTFDRGSPSPFDRGSPNTFDRGNPSTFDRGSPTFDRGSPGTFDRTPVAPSAPRSPAPSVAPRSPSTFDRGTSPAPSRMNQAPSAPSRPAATPSRQPQASQPSKKSESKAKAPDTKSEGKSAPRRR